jgi:hypothetical protein
MWWAEKNGSWVNEKYRCLARQRQRTRQKKLKNNIYKYFISLLINQTHLNDFD